jgi:hypothetical protein
MKRTSEIEQTRRFARLLSKMTPRQLFFLRDFMSDLEGRPPNESKRS